MKIPKRELKRQNELLELLKKESLTREEIEIIYEEFNPGMISEVGSAGAFFTPLGLARDCALFTPRSGHIVDVCAGIGVLSRALFDYDSYDKKIKSITCIEINPKYVEIGRKLCPRAKWICSDAFDQDLWKELTKDLKDNRFDSCVSNPPFGRIKSLHQSDWLSYQGNKDLEVLELCLRFAKNGYFILPVGSSPFKFSGELFYKEQMGRELKRFIKGQTMPFTMTADGIDCDVHKDGWKNLNGIKVEAVNIDIYPWSLTEKDDSMQSVNIQ